MKTRKKKSVTQIKLQPKLLCEDTAHGLAWTFFRLFLLQSALMGFGVHMDLE